MGEGSRWYFPTFEGLYDGKHVQAMGSAIWLYGWMLARAWVAQKEGVFNYQHDEAAEDLKTPRRTVRFWFQKLQEHSYILTRVRHPYHLEIEIANWRSVEEWLEARADGQRVASLGARDRQRIVTLDGQQIASLSQSDKESDKESDNGLPLSPITIRLSDYEYPEDQNPPGLQLISLSHAFQGLMDALRLSRNKGALLKQIYHLCFGGWGDEEPSYGYLGKVARQVGGAGRLAQMMWELSANRPQGDVLAYIQAMHKAKDRRNGHKPKYQEASNDIQYPQNNPAEIAALIAQYEKGAEG